mgnify:FL=1
MPRSLRSRRLALDKLYNEELVDRCGELASTLATLTDELARRHREAVERGEIPMGGAELVTPDDLCNHARACLEQPDGGLYETYRYCPDCTTIFLPPGK